MSLPVAPATATPPLSVKQRSPYSPPQYLLASTGLSREQLISQYEEFNQSLEHVQNAPQLVFERLIGNLNEAFNKGLSQEQTRHAAAEEAWHVEKAVLQSSLDSATAAGKILENPPTHPSTSIPATIASKSKETYLQFSFTGAFGIHAAATTTPIPYTPVIYTTHGIDLAYSGYYDTRMDEHINTAIIPATVSVVIPFKTAFATPPGVVVWLTGLSATNDAVVTVNATATNVTESEFVLQISSGGPAQLASVGAAWAVWPDVPERLTTGSVDFVGPEGARVPIFDAKGVENPRNACSSVIRLAVVSAVEVVLKGTLTIDLFVSEIYTYPGEEFAWRMTVGPSDAEVYSTRVTYVLELA